MWHVAPLIVIIALAGGCQGYNKLQLVRRYCGNNSMSYSSFGYYGQIWFNRAYTYECAV